jgi:hypothetical protein
MTPDNTRIAYRLAWETRRAENGSKAPIDNAALPAGSPMFFRCPSCYGDIILPEGYLTRPAVCYDCLDLLRRGWIVELPAPGTGWTWRPKVRRPLVR